MTASFSTILRSLTFDVWLYGSMVVLGLVLAPAALTRRGAIWAMRLYCRQALWMMAAVCGLRVEVRGAVPQGRVLIASKHQSFLDVLILMREAPAPAFVMKRSLVWMPIFGIYALRLGCAPIDRGRRVSALKGLRRWAARLREKDPDAQIVIYPQGSRVPPGEVASYRRGAAALYAADGSPCVPAATNAGVFWPRSGRWRRPGVAVFEFLSPIEPGLGADTFMSRLEGDIERVSAALELEAYGAGELETAS